nr:UDP flavonoid: 3-O-glucosyltransferase [Ipomoea batatas]
MTRTCSTNCTVAVYLSGGVAIETNPDFCQKGNGLEQKLKVIPGMSELSIGEIPREILAKDLQVSFPGMIYNMALKLPGANAVVLNSFQKLEPTVTYDLRSKLQKVFNIGPMILQSSATPKPPIPDDHNCIPWLDSLPPATLAVLPELGVGPNPPGDEIVALAEGWKPKKGDQTNKHQIVESVWEIGVKVEGGIFTKDETMKALSVVLDSDRGKQLKENVVKLKGKL